MRNNDAAQDPSIHTNCVYIVEKNNLFANVLYNLREKNTYSPISPEKSHINVTLTKLIYSNKNCNSANSDLKNSAIMTTNCALECI